VNAMPGRSGGSRTPSERRSPVAGAGFRARAGIVRAWVTGIVTVAVAFPTLARAGPGAGSPVEVVVVRGEEHCHVTGGFRVPLRPAAAWEVIRDYDHIPRFVSSMVSSRSERRDGRLLVHQVARAGFLLFHKNVEVELDVTEVPMEQIVFEDRLRRDFEFYGGSWTIGADSAGTRVDYALSAEPRGSLPRAMCRGALRHAAQELLEQVRQEMLRRSSAEQGPEAGETKRGR